MIQIVGYNKDKDLDLVLVSAPSSDNYESDEIREIPAYGLGTIATVAKSEGFNVGVLDAEAQPRFSLEEIADHIRKYYLRIRFG